MFGVISRRRAKAQRKQSAIDLRQQFLSLVKETQPDTFVEVGAYDATTSLEIRGLLPSARVVAFEANPFNHKRFVAELHHERANVEYVHSAISNSVGTLTFNVGIGTGDNQDKRGSILDRTDNTWRQQEVTVPCTTLDTFFADRMPAQSALWIDVEGASREVLEGATNILRTASLVLIEVETHRFWEGQWLADETIAYLEGGGLQPIARDREYPEQYNVLLRRLD